MSKGKTSKNIKIATNLQPGKDSDDVVPEDYTDPRTLTITIKQIENIEPLFNVTDIFVQVSHFNVKIGQSEKTALVDKQLCPIDYETTISYNIADSKCFDKLISSPLYFTIWQTAGVYNEEMYAAFSDSSEEFVPMEVRQREMSTYEAILGVKLAAPSAETAMEEEEHGHGDIKKGKSKKSASKASQKPLPKTSATSKKKKSNEEEGSAVTIRRRKASEKSARHATGSNVKVKDEKQDRAAAAAAAAVAFPTEPVLVGSCNVDLLPLFLGETEFEESTPVHQQEIYQDDRVVPVAELPRILVNIRVDRPIVDAAAQPLTNILHFTVEAMYNLPVAAFSEGVVMDYKVATVFPVQNLLVPFELGSGCRMERPCALKQCKVWPDLAHMANFSSCTKYSLDSDYACIKSKKAAAAAAAAAIDIKAIVESSAPRVHWNILRRRWLDEWAADTFHRNLSRHRCWPLEVYLRPAAASGQAAHEVVTDDAKPKKKKASKASVRSKSKSSGSSKSSGKSKLSAQHQAPEPLHLMAFVDISTLLYPGVTKSRVATELKLFQMKEFTEETGVDDSYFYVKEEPKKPGGGPRDDALTKNKSSRAAAAAAAHPKAKGKEDSSSKKSGGNSSKGKKSKAGAKESAVQEAAEPAALMIPSAPPLKNSQGEPTFIIVEVELLKPFVQKVPLVDLTNELQSMLPVRPQIPRAVAAFNTAMADYRECVHSLAHEINKEYQRYSCTAGSRPEYTTTTTTTGPIDFVKHLQVSGAYHKYVTTLMKSVPTLLRERYHFSEDAEDSLAQERFVSQAYVYLVDEMNVQVNSLAGSHDTGSPSQQLNHLLCAMEAEELDAPQLAERYYQQAISEDARNPDRYLHYAIFLTSRKQHDEAIEYLKESLALELDHKYSLLLLAILLYEKGDYASAESVFLLLTECHETFLESWACLYLFYVKRGGSNAVGCDVCLEHVAKCGAAADSWAAADSFRSGGSGSGGGGGGELAWSTVLCPQSEPWFRTALLLIKLRALNFADLALGCRNVREGGAYRYYQAVVLYYLGDYEHALAHLLLAQKIYGSAAEVNALLGHCYLRLGDAALAKDAYEFITYSYTHAEDMHMVYLNLAILYEQEHKLEMARKYLLHTCKHSSTPYSWLCLGVIFYKERNWVCAEACLSESNTLDNGLCESWAYLVLVNVELGRSDAARQCYAQLKKRNFHNEELLSLVEKEVGRMHGNDQ